MARVVSVVVGRAGLRKLEEDNYQQCIRWKNHWVQENESELSISSTRGAEGVRISNFVPNNSEN
jgi:hypothetical protein